MTVHHAATVDAMLALGRAAAREAAPGMVFGLVGDLGAGKTHWTKGFVAGIGSTEPVTSPTFAIVHVYDGGVLPVFHFDFYRLGHPAEVVGVGWDEYLEEPGVVIVEWADRFPELLPAHTRWLRFGDRTGGALDQPVGGLHQAIGSGAGNQRFRGDKKRKKTGEAFHRRQPTSGGPACQALVFGGFRLPVRSHCERTPPCAATC
jgi:tRNA threonylcarbamoyladenosine biosynthesis protein TsaE